MDNDYFKEGSQKAIEWLEGAGIDVPKPDIEGISTHAAEVRLVHETCPVSLNH